MVNILFGVLLVNILLEWLVLVLGGGIVVKNIVNIIVLVILIYVLIVFGELYFKCIVLNKLEEVVKFILGLICLIGVVVKFFVWLFFVFISLLVCIILMIFDDEDLKMIRDEMCYMFENEGVLNNEELEMF